MSLKAKLEAIIYAAETPITLDHIVELLSDLRLPKARPKTRSSRTSASRLKN